MINDQHPFMMKAKKAVLIGYPKINVDVRDLKIVWFDETSDPWRAIISIDTIDDVRFDVTYDRPNKRTYVEVYPEKDWVTVSDLQIERYRNL